MSRPINSSNKISSGNTSGVLKIISSQAVAATTSALPTAKTLTIDTLNVRNIYLLDTLHAKNSIDINSPDRMTLSKGVITNTLSSNDTVKKALKFNNVYFEPNIFLSNIVSLYTDNQMNLGNIHNILSMFGSDINMTPINAFNLMNNNLTFGNSSSANISINYLGSLHGIRNTAQFNYVPSQNVFSFTKGANIYGNLSILANLFIRDDVTISGNLNIINRGNVYIFNNTAIYQDLIVQGNVNIGGNIDVNYDVITKSNLFVRGGTANIGVSNITSNLTTNYVGVTSGVFKYDPVAKKFFLNRDFRIFGNLEVTNEIIYSNLNIFSNANVYGNLSVQGNALIMGNLDVMDTANIYLDLGVDGDFFLAKNANIHGSLCVDRNLYVTGNSNIKGNNNTDQNIYVGNNANIRGNTQIEANLFVRGTGNIYKDLGLGKNLFVRGNTNIMGNTQIDSTLFILGSANIYGNLTLDNDLIAGNNVYIRSLYVANTANIIGNVGIDSSLFISNNANINNNLGVGSNIYSNNMIVSNNIVINNNKLTTNSNFLEYNSNVILSVNTANILNISNIVIIDITNNQDVLFDVRGNISCNSVYLTSNVDKKKNIREISEDEIIKLTKIKGYNFDLKSNNNNNYGFLAHEVEEIYPILSNGDSVNYIGFIPLLLSKIRMMEHEINMLKEKLSN